MTKIAVIGAGAWGTTISILLAQNNFDISLWSYEKEVVAEALTYKENKKYLPGFKLQEHIQMTNSLKDCVCNAEAIIFVVPTQKLRDVAKEVANHIGHNVKILSASKGIEISTLKRPSEVIAEFISLPIAVLSGPNLAKEIAKGLPAAAVVAADKDNSSLAEYFQSLFKDCKTFRVYSSSDPIGVELGGALKNIIAIASGALEGLELGDNAKAALIMRGISEIQRLGVAMGARPETFAGLSGLGDLITTCQSVLSRNHTVGFRLAKGEKLDNITKSSNEIAEGVPTTKAAIKLKEKFEVEMPITDEIHKVLFQNKKIDAAILDLMSRPLKSEH